MEIGTPARLSLKDTQLVIERDQLAKVTVPLEDLGVLVVDSLLTTISLPLLVACGERAVAVVICDAKHIPVSLLTPLEGNSLHARTLRDQVEASLPVKKRLWQAIIRAKIREQGNLLKEFTGEDGGLIALVDKVGSGDPQNVEARAARAYFTRLFGKGFIRDRYGIPPNNLLNYGYAVVRAAVARAVIGAGMHPALGIHHTSQYNAFALADDLFEPLRPVVDNIVVKIFHNGTIIDELIPDLKHSLLESLTEEVQYDNKRYPLMTALEYYASNLRQCLTGEQKRLQCPGRLPP